MEFWQRYSKFLIFSLIMIIFLVLQGVVVIKEQRDNLNTIHHERLQDDLNLIAMMAYEAILKYDHVTMEKVLTQWAEMDQDIVELTAVAANQFVLVQYRNPNRGGVLGVHQREVMHEGELLLHITIHSNNNRAREDLYRLSVKLGILSIFLMILFGIIIRLMLWHTSVLPLEEEISKRKLAEQQTDRISKIHATINDLLLITLQPIPLRDQLRQALNKLFTIPWLAIEAKGAIFLADREQTRLTMAVQEGLDDALLVSCQTILFGRCLCGRAASQKEILFSNHLDSRHDIRFDGMQDHGHYCVPILSAQEVLGVFTLFVEEGHVFSIENKNFLQSVANTLEGLILRQRSADDLLQLNELLEQKVELRTEELRASMEYLHQARDQLHQSEKMAALGRLVAGISHEINTPVGIAYTASSFLEERSVAMMAKYRDQGVTGAELYAFMENMEEASRLILSNLERAAQLIRSFKQVAVDQSSDNLRMINLGAYCQEIIDSLRPKLRQINNQMRLQCPDNLKVISYPGVFFQIISNLVMNSLLHGFEERAEGRITLDISLDGADTVSMIYRDNGKGIDINDEKRIFEPFFTTKIGLGGSGLGLHIVYNLVTQSLRGSIVCHGFPGEGAEFVIRFPRCAE
ncbi:MAG: GAF domain-containing sensor histidine kinase [Magnetococcus sp. YQC-5]